MRRKRVARRYRYKYQNNRIRPRVGKKLVLAATASILALSVAGVSFWNFLQSATPVEAQESFSGIGKVVEAHSEEEPFVILDIVPGTATYAYTFSSLSPNHGQTISIPNVSIGTMGYLTDRPVWTGEGLVSVEEGLKTTFDSYQDGFLLYEERAALASSLLPAGMDSSLLQINYKEGYAGITSDLSVENGWHQIYDSYFPEAGAAQKLRQTGLVYAMMEPYIEGSGADRTGFDYNLLSGTFSMDALGDGVPYKWADANGAYHIIFEYKPEAALQGYEIVDAIPVDGTEGDITATTSVYRLKDGVFEYAGLFGDIPESVEIPQEEEKVNYEEDTVLPDTSIVPGTSETPGVENPENPGGVEDMPETPDTSDQPETPTENPGEPGNVDGAPTNPDNENDIGTGDGTGSDADNPSTGEGGNTGEGGEDVIPGEDGNTGGDVVPGEDGNIGGDTDNSGTGEETESDANNAGTGDSIENYDSGETSTQSAPIDVQDMPMEAAPETAALVWRKLVFVPDSSILVAEAGLQPVEGASAGTPGTIPDSPSDTEQSGGGVADAERPDPKPTDPGNPDVTESQEPSTTPGSSEGTVLPTEPDAAVPPTGPAQSGTTSDGTTSPDTVVPALPSTAGATEEGYYIVKFRYVSGLEEARSLYQIETVRLVEEVAIDGVPPIDTYDVENDNALANSSMYAVGGNGTEDGIEPLMNVTAAEFAFVYAGAGQGGYKLQEVPETDGTGHTIMVYNAPTFFRCNGGTDWLERYVFHSLAGDDNESENFSVQVKVLTANQVTYDDVKEADLVYLEAGLGDLLGSGATIHYMTESGGDMPKDALFGIVYRAVMDQMPVIAEYGIIEANYGYTGTDQEAGTGQTPGDGQDLANPSGKMVYQNLVQILLKKNLVAFYQDLETVDNMLMNITGSKYPDKVDNNYNYVNRNIYIINGETLVSEDFYAPFNDEKISAGFMEVFAALRAENSTLAEEDQISEIVSKARAMQYIINYAVGLISDFRDIRVLELQPTTNPHSDLKIGGGESDGYTVLYWEKEGSPGPGQQILRSSKVIDIAVEKLSVAEFSGSQSDINDRYQMIFIGLDGQRLNYERDDKRVRYVAYNDPDMNGLVYSGTGDLATKDGERYEGIDITPQKKDALLDFMKAGYPIVVEDDFFTGQSAKDADVNEINADYVGSDSQMYDFLLTAVNEYNDYLYTISDVHSSAVFAAQVNIRRPQIRFTDAEENEDGEQPGRLLQIRADAEGRYRGTIGFKVEDDRGEEYSDNVDIRVYLDQNQDGRFAPDEEVYSGFSTDNGEFTIEFDTPQKGILPWKLEVSDSGNSYRRDALTGFFEIYDVSPTKIRILQIAPENIDLGNMKISDSVDENEAAKYNLALAYLAKDQTMMGHFLENAEGLTNSEFEIKTISAAELAAQLSQNAKFLEGFDVLVLGFGPAENLENVAGAINQFIAQGRGVLVSSSAALGETGRMGIDVTALGQSDIRTYEALGQEKGDLRYYRYAPLRDNMFGEKNNLTVRRINDGSVAHYPFEIGESGRLAQAVKGGDYVLNLHANGNKDSIADVTAWYCLEDSDSADTLSAYDVSERDAANNYYLYSRGNVFYIGEDYYAYEYEEAPGVEPPSTKDGVMECRLFVNALMAAYNVGIKNPKVTIVAGLAPDAPEIESICIPFDEQLIGAADGNVGLLDETTDVYFKITEPNLAFGKEVRISFYYQDDAGGTSIDIGGENVLASPFSSQVWTVEDNRLVEVGTEFNLVPGKVYKIKAPVIPLRNESRTNADIYIVVESHFRHFGTDAPVTGSDSIVLNRAQLFLLE